MHGTSCRSHSLGMILPQGHLGNSTPQYLFKPASHCNPHYGHTPSLISENLTFHLIGLPESTVASQADLFPNKWPFPSSQESQFHATYPQCSVSISSQDVANIFFFFHFFLFCLFLMGGQLLYNVVFVSTIDQHESAISILMAPPSRTSLSNSLPIPPL